MNFRILSDHYHAKIIERKKIATLSLVIHFLLQYSITFFISVAQFFVTSFNDFKLVWQW